MGECKNSVQSTGRCEVLVQIIESKRPETINSEKQIMQSTCFILLIIQKLGTIASKINITHKGVDMPISKVHSILPEANILAHNNKSQICYCGQILV